MTDTAIFLPSAASDQAPSAGAALDYVRAQLANVEGVVAVCGTVAPGRDNHGTIPGTRDVLFTLQGERRPRRFTVWSEEGVLYGEW